jgi:NADH-quinone oxidoreductase subunit J
MIDFFFYLFAFLTLGGALLVVGSRNAVNAAMFLIISFLGMATLFVLLESYFLAVLQVLVYAGAVIVLFLFIVMLLDTQGGERKAFKILPGAAAGFAFVLLIMSVFTIFGKGELTDADSASVVATGSSLKAFGYQLFTTYLLPLQMTGFLLLVAMIGVIVLSKGSGKGGEEDES